MLQREFYNSLLEVTAAKNKKVNQAGVMDGKGKSQNKLEQTEGEFLLSRVLNRVNRREFYGFTSP